MKSFLPNKINALQNQEAKKKEIAQCTRSTHHVRTNAGEMWRQNKKINNKRPAGWGAARARAGRREFGLCKVCKAFYKCVGLRQCTARCPSPRHTFSFSIEFDKSSAFTRSFPKIKEEKKAKTRKRRVL